MLSEELKSLQISPEKWFRMNVNQREIALQKFWKTHLPSPSHKNDISREDHVYPEVDQSQQLRPFSVDPEESGLAGIPLLLHKDLFGQTSKLLANEEAIMPASSHQEHSFVVRNDNGGRPYDVFQQTNGKVVCDQCERYKSAKICCHSLAVAAKCSALEKFLSWYRRSPQTITATSFVTSDSPKTVGRIGDQDRPSTRRRKGGRSKPQRSRKVTKVQRAHMLSLQPSQPLGQANAVSSNGATSLTTQPTRPLSPMTTLAHPPGSTDQPLANLLSISRKTFPLPSYGSF